jgi:hypothetical protein
MDPASLPVGQRVALLVKALNGAKRTNDNASIHLHARKIEFLHPVKKTPVCIVAPPPDDALWNEFLRVSLQV